MAEGRQVEDRPALLLPRELAGGDRLAQPPVALRVARDNEQVLALRIREPVLGFGEIEAEFRTEDGGQPDRFGRLRKSHDAVHPVVVGEGEGLEAEARRFFGEFLGMARAVEKAEVGMAVEFRIGRG